MTGQGQEGQAAKAEATLGSGNVVAEVTFSTCNALPLHGISRE